MADLLWPGDERADSLASDAAFLDAMVRVEQAWADALTSAGISPGGVALAGLVGADDVDELARAAEASGNPVVALVRLLRARLESRDDAVAAAWLHRGLTSQDVVDTALVLVLREVADRVLAEMRGQVGGLAGLVETHRASAMVGRTLTQHAVPTTFGVAAATWLTGLLDAAEDLAAARAALPVSVGGAAGTLSAATVLARASGSPDPGPAALDLVRATADALGLATTSPWHVSRRPLTRLTDALVSCTDAWGHLAADVLILGRPEIAEVREPAEEGRGGSSTMPQKQNPVLSLLLRRAAIAAPPLASTLHIASALADDQRSDGAWQAEWDTARTLARRTAVAASHASELIAGLHVDADRMRTRLDAVASEVTAERRAAAALADADGADTTGLILPDDLGAADAIVDAVLSRARTTLESLT